MKQPRHILVLTYWDVNDALIQNYTLPYLRIIREILSEGSTIYLMTLQRKEANSDMVLLEKNAKKIITDSGGVQKEAFFMHKPCITMRDQTEWVETVNAGWNVIVGADKNKNVNAINNFNPTAKTENLFGNGNASQLMVDHIKSFKR